MKPALLFVGGAVAGALIVGGMSASIGSTPSTAASGSITACVKRKTGEIRIVNSASKCRHNERAVRWSSMAQPPMGASEATGTVYTTTVGGTVRWGFTGVGQLRLPAGSYEVDALATGDGDPGEGVVCRLVNAGSGEVLGVETGTTVGGDGLAENFTVSTSATVSTSGPISVGYECQSSGGMTSVRGSLRAQSVPGISVQ